MLAKDARFVKSKGKGGRDGARFRNRSRDGDRGRKTFVLICRIWS